MSKTGASVSSGVPNSEKQMKARCCRQSAFFVSRCLEPLMKHKAQVFEMTSQPFFLLGLRPHAFICFSGFGYPDASALAAPLIKVLNGIFPLDSTSSRVTFINKSGPKLDCGLISVLKVLLMLPEKHVYSHLLLSFYITNSYLYAQCPYFYTIWLSTTAFY